MRLVRQQYGYSLVQIVSGGQLGWVANADLGPAQAPMMTDDMAGSNDSSAGSAGAGTMPLIPDAGRDPAIADQSKINDHPGAQAPFKGPTPTVEPSPSPQPKP